MSNLDPPLPDDVMATAREAKCARCDAVVVDEPSIVGTVMLNYYVPATGLKDRVVLCGMCGLVFREFLRPEVLNNPAFQAAKAALQEKWA